MGRIQLVKTFVIPIFMYLAGLVSVHKDIIKEANKLIFQFIWKVKDKVKRSTLISDQESGGLTAPHLESIIKTQRLVCCKKFLEIQQSSWKKILSHYLNPIGGKLIFGCAFDIKKLPIKLPRFYEECLKHFAEFSTATEVTDQETDRNKLAKAVIWNNKYICVDGKAVFHRT